MKLRMSITILPAILLMIIAGCATMESSHHKYIMKGQILEMTDNMAYLCIGSKDGAAVGQELTAYKYVKSTSDSRRAPKLPYQKEETGKVKITEIVDEHYAWAKVLSGEVKANYTVELE